MVSCGEPSGDLYAGALVSSLSALDPHIEVRGFGGAGMAGAGAELIGDYRGFAVTGLVEALSVVRKSWTMLRTLGAAARARRPDVFVAIDFPDFNFRLLPPMRRLGIPIVYYVSPQIWAWRPSRIATLRQYVDRMLVIFPFEEAFYAQSGIPVEFVGHPLVDLAKATEGRDRFLAAHGLVASRTTLALLPGSRPNEVRENLPTIVEAVRIIAATIPDLQCVVARAPALDAALFSPLDALRSSGVTYDIVEGATDNVLASADAVITASGTATIQAALHECPMIVVYRLAPLTYAVGRRFVRVKTYGMVNLVAGNRIVPELIQDEFTPEAAAKETLALLLDREKAETMRRALRTVKERLGRPGASDRAARAVLEVARASRSGSATPA
jgi:lipid-A-disaccharide synthase